MKTLIIVHSYHNNNTLKVAHAMAEVLDADVKTCEQAMHKDLGDYDLVGFGAGIDTGKHYRELLDFADDIPLDSEIRKCFVFSTAGIYNEKKMKKDHSHLNLILKNKGYAILGEFSCKGLDTYSFLKVFGGLNKNHPNEVDIINAKQFALGLKYGDTGFDTSALEMV